MHLHAADEWSKYIRPTHKHACICISLSQRNTTNPLYIFPSISYLVTSQSSLYMLVPLQFTYIMYTEIRSNQRSICLHLWQRRPKIGVPESALKHLRFPPFGINSDFFSPTFLCAHSTFLSISLSNFNQSCRSDCFLILGSKSEREIGRIQKWLCFSHLKLCTLDTRTSLA